VTNAADAENGKNKKAGHKNTAYTNRPGGHMRGERPKNQKAGDGGAFTLGRGGPKCFGRRTVIERAVLRRVTMGDGEGKGPRNGDMLGDQRVY